MTRDIPVPFGSDSKLVKSAKGTVCKKELTRP